MSSIVTTADLARITGYTRSRDIERCLSEQGIKVFRARKGAVWTTVELINQAGGLQQPTNNDDHYNPEDIL